MFLNTLAFKKWSLFLSDDISLDKDIFLFTSILPYSYLSIHKGKKKLILVNLQQIAEFTNLAYKGLNTLVENGYASWLYLDKSFDSESEYDGTLIIGEYKGIRPYLFIEKKCKLNSEKGALKELSTEQQSTKPEIEVPYLSTIFKSYDAGGNTLGYSSNVPKNIAEVNKLISIIRSGKVNRINFLKYFYYVNYMLLNMVNMPSDNDIRKKSKELKVSTEIISSLSEEELVNIVPYFVYNYPEYAPKNYPDTNIWTLKFSLPTTLRKLRGVETPKVQSFKKATTVNKFGEDDKL